MPWTALAAIGGTIALVLLIVYLVIQSTSSSSTSASPSEAAEQNDSTDIPGNFAPSQGRGHYQFSYSPEITPMPFCDDVAFNGSAGSVTAVATASSTPIATGTPPAGTPQATPTVPQDCRNSNPPSSGEHLGVQRNVEVGAFIMNIPPDPDVYPIDLDIPRDAIPHILEHAGVFVGYNCASGDTACEDVVQELTDIVNNRIDNHDDRAVMARYSDLPEGQIGLASWTRWDRFDYTEFDADRVTRFIGENACRFDPEGFCG